MGQAGAGDPGTGQMKGTPKAARSVASHPVSPAPILTAIHQDRRKRHSQIRSKIEGVHSGPEASPGLLCNRCIVQISPRPSGVVVSKSVSKTLATWSPAIPGRSAHRWRNAMRLRPLVATNVV